MKRRSVLRAGVAGGVAALLPRFAIGQSADARVLRFVPQANLTVLDPIVTTAAVTANHAWMVWDTLFGVNAAQQAKPQMADGYTISDDGRTYLIKLREGLRWHDGEPVRAQDCAASLARWAVRNTFGQTAAKSVDEWGVADDKTVKITLKRPFPLLIDAIAVQNSFIMPERLAKTDPFKAIDEVIGSGPYRFLKDEFVPRSSARLGEVRRLCAAPGAGGMVQRWQDRQLSADRVEDYHGRGHRVGRVAERRGRLVRASASRSRPAAETQQRYRHRAVKPARLHRRPAVQLSSPTVQ
jgi:peptide/nickel transport system substrate-binding protein